MKYLFSPEGQPALKALAAKNMLIALDFDGTLAPIVHQPTGAQMPLSMAQELEQLCSVASVAIISGRSLGDIQQRVSAKVAYLIGNHGNEGVPGLDIDGVACRKICAQWMAQLRHMPDMQLNGVYTEAKGYTLSVHYRLADDHVAARQLLPKAFEKLHPAARIVPGKCVFNLFPPGTICKDGAMEALVVQTQAENVLYIGDDECDEVVFTHAQPGWITIRVGYWQPSAAKYYLRYQHEVRDLLILLNRQLGPART